MIVNTDYIREKIIEVWPEIDGTRIIPWDPKYWLIPEAQIGLLLEKSSIPDMDFIPEFNDCDNFALQFQAETRRKRYLAWKGGNLIKDERYPVAMAIAWGSMWRGISKNHVANLFVCQEGVYLADSSPMEKRYWKADADNDNILTMDFR